MTLVVQRKVADGTWEDWGLAESYGAVMEFFRIMRNLGYVCRYRRVEGIV